MNLNSLDIFLKISISPAALNNEKNNGVVTLKCRYFVKFRLVACNKSSFFCKFNAVPKFSRHIYSRLLHKL